MNASRSLRFAALLLAVVAGRATAQQPSAVAADMLADLKEAESKLVGLAEAIPADRYDWRPGEGVRSVAEVFMHVAGDNYLMTAPFGVAAPEDTGIKVEDYRTAVTFEQRSLSKEQVISELKRSLANLEAGFSKVDDEKANQSIQLFGSEMTLQRLMIMATTHVHEHLGQSIAYARSNGIVPPWSR